MQYLAPVLVFVWEIFFSMHGLLLQPHISHKLLNEQISTKNNDLWLMYTKVSRVEAAASISIFCKIFGGFHLSMACVIGGFFSRFQSLQWIHEPTTLHSNVFEIEIC